MADSGFPVTKISKLIHSSLLTGMFLLLVSCDKNENSTEKSASNTPQLSTKQNVSAPSDEDKINKGKTIYFSTCITCHNRNPEKDGAVGPAIKGSSFELIKARIQNQGYPPGYKPKRNTKLMPKLPFNDEQIANIAAFLK